MAAHTSRVGTRTKLRLRSALRGALLTGLASASIAAAQAAEPTIKRFNENDMLDAARRAVGAADTRPVNIGIPPADELRILEARREVELKRLSEKLKRAAEARGPQKADNNIPEPAWTTEVTSAPPEGLDVRQRTALGAVPENGTAASSPDFGLKGVATILLVLNGSGDRSSAPERAGDPILCVNDGCYVSNGPQAQASYHSFGQSLSFTGRLGRGAGACNHTKGCIFRSLELGTALTMVQPIDLKFVRHERREQREVVIDSSCKVLEGRLSCSRPVRTGSYTLWIVPEHIAREAGSDKLAEAVADGLLTARTAELPWSANK